MHKPIEEALHVLAKVEDLYHQGLSKPQIAGALLLMLPEILEVLSNALDFQIGYQDRTQLIAKQVRRLLKETLAASNGELKWATELPPGKAPGFRRELNALQSLLNRTQI